uniref:39S ribosomal protein L41, mitochondrial n=1 Tax=Arion vulgaris TaxID=1028688 RepID=A0A0B6XYC9_9EUPU
MFVRRTHAAAVFQISKRFLNTSICLCGRKSRLPWDQRFPVFAEDVAPDKKGGSEEMMKALPENIVAPTGYYHAVTKEYIHVPEMVPEFVVPDLTAFELKPYVSYKAKEIVQDSLTPQEIFNTVYASKIEDEFKDGDIKVNDGQIVLQDGRTLTVDHQLNNK